MIGKVVMRPQTPSSIPSSRHGVTLPSCLPPVPRVAVYRRMAEAGIAAYFWSARAALDVPGGMMKGRYGPPGIVVVHGGEDMDFSNLIPIVAVVVGVPGFVAFIALVMGHTRKMKELAIRDKELEMGGSDAALGPAVDALSDDLNDTRAQVAEIQERLDFAERLLAAGSPPENDRSG